MGHVRPGAAHDDLGLRFAERDHLEVLIDREVEVAQAPCQPDAPRVLAAHNHPARPPRRRDQAIALVDVFGEVLHPVDIQDDAEPGIVLPCPAKLEPECG